MKRDGAGVIYDIEDFELEHHGDKLFCGRRPLKIQVPTSRDLSLDLIWVMCVPH
jgi:hypothetical protein